MSTVNRAQKSYDHRLKELVRSTANIDGAIQRGVPRSTARGWLTKHATEARAVRISGYYMQIFLNLVASEGRTVENDVQVMRVVRNWTSRSLKSEAFRLRLDKWHEEHRRG